MKGSQIIILGYVVILTFGCHQKNSLKNVYLKNDLAQIENESFEKVQRSTEKLNSVVKEYGNKKEYLKLYKEMSFLFKSVSALRNEILDSINQAKPYRLKELQSKLSEFYKKSFFSYISKDTLPDLRYPNNYFAVISLNKAFEKSVKNVYEQIDRFAQNELVAVDVKIKNTEEKTHWKVLLYGQFYNGHVMSLNSEEFSYEFDQNLKGLKKQQIGKFVYFEFDTPSQANPKLSVYFYPNGKSHEIKKDLSLFDEFDLREWVK